MLQTNQIRICAGVRNGEESSSNKLGEVTSPLDHLDEPDSTQRAHWNPTVRRGLENREAV
jgi:hypothetical protein